MASRPSHSLDPLLRPRSVAVIGASARADSMGEWALENLRRGGYDGAIYPVNPRYDALAGLVCYPSLQDLPARPDLAIFALGDRNLEAAFDAAVSAGIPAAVIMSTLALDDDAKPPLRERVRNKAAAAGMLLCGANGMGFYNVRDGVWACGFDSRMHRPPGTVALVSHSGAGMSGIIDSEERLRINLAVSTGNELDVTMDRYLDFALDLPETRAVGLFVETARNPAGFREALAKAAKRGIPVVALKVGRTAESARLTVSHSGAIAGDSSTYDALFDRYGVQQVRDMDELATTLILFSELHPVGPGGLVSLHDSGGERQLMIDLADEARVPLTQLQPATVAALEAVIDPELPAVNPLDAWSRGGGTAAGQMSRGLSLMMQDPGTALGVVQHDRAPDGRVYPGYIDYMETARRESGKPVALVGARQGSGYDELAISATYRGLPVLDGVPVFLRGVRALFAYRDFLARRESAMHPPAVPEAAVAHWSAVLASQPVLPEEDALTMLADFGIRANRSCIAENEKQLLDAAESAGYPVVVKTAMPGVLHKTETRGVHLNIADQRALREAWMDLRARCGDRVLVAPMIAAGVEMFIGARRDAQFGPVVMIGTGGIHAELLQDVVFLLPPFDSQEAARAVHRLELAALLAGTRGCPPADVDALCEAAARFSAMIYALRDVIDEADVNPLIVGEHGCKAVDALIVGRANGRR
ncbi:MAG: acetate--CoA ligase family protein [Woeseiaceae bacterium]|nr:acetate--CoA ligase family protein [Woeseiaceae bacterium]